MIIDSVNTKLFSDNNLKVYSSCIALDYKDEILYTNNIDFKRMIEERFLNDLLEIMESENINISEDVLINNIIIEEDYDFSSGHIILRSKIDLIDIERKYNYNKYKELSFLDDYLNHIEKISIERIEELILGKKYNELIKHKKSLIENRESIILICDLLEDSNLKKIIKEIM